MALYLYKMALLIFTLAKLETVQLQFFINESHKSESFA